LRGTARRTSAPSAWLAAVLVVLGVALVPGRAVAHPGIWASANGQIVFRSDRTGHPDVFAVDAGGSNLVNLTESSDPADLQPAWSPDGGRIAFLRRFSPQGRTDLFVMTAAGTGRDRLTSTKVAERDPAWSPTGVRIAYSARVSPEGPYRIFVVRADGSGRTRLTEQAAGSADRAPVWSPDGTRIAFVSDRAGGFPELYVMNADGTAVSRVTNNTQIDGNPSWSPDGTRLVFERCCQNGTSDIFSIDLATRTETNLTASTTHQDFDPVSSPDGTRIAYVSFEVGQGNLDIWVMNADGSAQTRLTQEAGPDLSPDWQPLPICTISGTGAADQLLGTDGNDVICPLEGADQVDAGAGADLVDGGRGNDVLQGQGGEDVLLGGGGGDTLGGGADYDVLDGGVGTDTCLPGGQGAARRACEA
jgi:Tol biopolymer transport system component